MCDPSGSGCFATCCPTLNFFCNLFCCRNCSYEGVEHGIKYPTNPTRLEAMGAPWLTKALRASGVINHEVAVASITVTEFGSTGLLSELRAVDLTYTQASDGAPKQVMVKFAPHELKTRAMVNLFGHLRNEFHFYAGAMAAKVPFRVPKPFYADMSYLSGNSCLIMERIVNADFRDLLTAPVTLDDARLIMAALAKMHAVWHGPGKIKDKDIEFVPRGDTEAMKLAGPEFLKAHKKTVEKEQGGEGWDYTFPTGLVDLHEDIAKHSFLLLQCTSAFPETLGVNHGDPRLENWFFYHEDGQKKCGALDWQVMSKGDVTRDLAWFFGVSCSVEFQTAHEAELLDLYFAELGKAGGPTVGPADRPMWDECYALSHVNVTATNVIGLGSIEPSATRVIPQMNSQMSNSFGAFNRLDCPGIWRKFRAGAMIIQQRNPEIMQRLNFEVATV